MGIFSGISNAMREAKEKANRAAMALEDRVEHMELLEACFLLEKELRNSNSISMQLSLNKVFNSKLNKCYEARRQEEMHTAFYEMYIRGKRSGSTYAINMAQRIGRRLYQMGDSRVDTNAEETEFRPKRSY